MIVGEQGTGRSTVARQIAANQGHLLIDATSVLTKAADNTLAQIAVSKPGTIVIVENLEVLPPPVLTALADNIRRGDCRYILTTVAGEKLAKEALYLVPSCTATIELPALRERTLEFSSIVMTLLSELRAPPSSRPTASALSILKAQPWPGNLAELRMVLRSAVDSRSMGDIGISDLPERYRTASASRANLTLLERAESEMIEKTLRAASGNKVHAARKLGISRSTLYSKLRYFGIS